MKKYNIEQCGKTVTNGLENINIVLLANEKHICCLCIRILDKLGVLPATSLIYLIWEY